MPHILLIHKKNVCKLVSVSNLGVTALCFKFRLKWVVKLEP
jgi:hypothetical protein